MLATATIITPKSENPKNIIYDYSLPTPATVTTPVLITDSMSLPGDSLEQVPRLHSIQDSSPAHALKTLDIEEPPIWLEVLFTTCNKLTIKEGYNYTPYTNIHSVMYNTDSRGLDFFVDTGSFICFISWQILSNYFSDLLLHTKDRLPVSLAGIGSQGLSTSTYINLLICLLILDYKILNLETKIYIVDNLLYKILLGLSFLKAYRLDIL